MKLTDKRYRNQIFKNTSFCNGGIAVWWTKKIFERCQFLSCDFSDALARGCRFTDCVFKRGKLQHFSMGGRTLILLRKSIYKGCTFERIKLRSLGIADFISCTFIDCDFNTAFITSSFSECKFIGNVRGCVFCGPKYNSYYYNDRLSYWISNKGRLNNVDFSEANIIDVDFRGGIDLSTTRLQQSDLSNRLNDKYSLESIGIDGFAYSKNEALRIVEEYYHSNEAILGGDVYKVKNGKIKLTYDSWYCERNSAETISEYVNRSYKIARDYISRYHSTTNILFGFVIEEKHDEI